MIGNDYIFYTPENQYPGMPHGEMCGDLMPFYWEGKYIFVFLYKYCIYAVETKDFVHYENLRLVLQNGSPDEQDWHAATGSVFYFDGTFYFYYTGFCEGNRGVEGKHEQAILRAVSRDLIHWEKDTEYMFIPDAERFGPIHWRDPQLIWDEGHQKILMLVTATEKDGAHQRGGCTAVYASTDALNWEFDKVIYSPGIYPTHECQDAFKMGDVWYLTFSTYSRWWETRYRMADSFYGSWKTPELDDMFDGRQFYAAKTVSDGTKRYLVGWQSIRRDCSDSNPFVWGGNVVVHELIQRSDNTLGVKLPDTIRAAFKKPVDMEFSPMRGLWEKSDNSTCIGKSEDGFGWVKIAEVNRTVLFEGTVRWSEDTQAFGLMVHTSGPSLEKWCQIRIEPKRERIAIERFNQIDGDQMYIDERRLRFSKSEAEIRVILSGNIIQTYVNDTALSSRCYSATEGGLGLFVECGEVSWSEFAVIGGSEDEKLV